MEHKWVWSNPAGWICLKLPVQVWQQRALFFLTSLSKVAPGTITSPDGLIHPLISTGCPFLLCSCAHVSSCTGINYCDASSALQFVACLGWQWCQMVFRDNPWADPRACDQHTELFLNSTVHIGREKNSLGAYGTYWQGHRSSPSALLSDRLARKWSLAHICGTAAGKDRRTCQQGPADRRLAVWLGWQGAAGWTSASRDIAYKWYGSRVKVQWWCAAIMREGAAVSTH